MRALVTGANGDIGFSVWNMLDQMGYESLVIDRSINRFSGASSHSPLTVMQMDLADSMKTAHSLAALKAPFDVMVHAAGIREIAPLTALELHQWQEVICVNLTAAFVVSKALVHLALMHQHPLCIIYISSVSGLQGEPERHAYCASKHGLTGLARSQAIELAAHDIRVNVIAPGVMETAMTKPYQSDPVIMASLEKNIPLKKWGKPHHVAQAVATFISNDYLTGTTLTVDGGWCAGKII